MDNIITMANAIFCGALALLLSWAVFTHRVQDGIVIKAGLIGAALGLGVTAAILMDADWCADASSLERARLLVHLGIGVMLAGYWRHRRAGRTICDIVDLTPEG